MILFLIFFTLQYKFISALLIQTFPSSSLLPDIPTLPVLDILVFTSRDRPPCLSNQNDSTACPSPIGETAEAHCTARPSEGNPFGRFAESSGAGQPIRARTRVRGRPERRPGPIS